jgi:hypothetical protein
MIYSHCSRLSCENLPYQLPSNISHEASHFRPGFRPGINKWNMKVEVGFPEAQGISARNTYLQ